MESIWSKTVDIPERAPLSGDCHTEAAVIGAGMAGILAAHYLKKQGKQVIVIEADRIGGGQTKNTTAKVTSQHGMCYQKLIKQYGRRRARLYAMANQAAVEAYAQLVREEGIACDFERVNAYLYSTEDEEKLKQECRAAQQLGLPAQFLEEIPLPFAVRGAVCFENQAQLHPLKFLKHLSENLTVYERTRAVGVRGNCIITNRGKIYAEHIVFATHYPFPNVPGFYFLRQHQERSYVVAASGVPDWKGIYYSADAEGLSFRGYRDMLLIGGGSHRTGGKAAGKKECQRNESIRKENRLLSGRNCSKQAEWEALFLQLRQWYPDCRQEAHWSAQDCVTHDSLLFAGAFSVLHPSWYVMTGFKKWGMTGAMVAAGIVCDRICKKGNPYAALFAPFRFHLWASAQKLSKDIRVSVAGLIKGSFYMPVKQRGMPPKGEARIVRMGWRRYGVYRDEEGMLHRVSVKCPHMGCKLEWNPTEQTWDCPCHGSRFDPDGRLIDNPAQTGLKNEITN